MKKAVNYIFVLTLLLVSCKKSSTDDGVYSSGYEYFPTNTGHDLIFDVDCVVYDDFRDTIITYTYQKRQLIADSFYDLSGKLNQRLEWYFRNHDTEEWVLNKAGSSVLKINTGEVVENGERIIKLVFPVQNNTDWNGYAYTTRTNEPEFYYRSTSKTFSSPAGNFANVAEVIHENDSNLIEKRFRAEWYAPLVGLVYKQIDSLETQFDNQGNPETKGYRYYQRLRSFTP